MGSTGKITEILLPYRNFRHRFISGYGFQLKGEKMLELIDNIKLILIFPRKSGHKEEAEKDIEISRMIYERIKEYINGELSR